MATTDTRPRTQSIAIVQPRTPNQSRTGKVFSNIKSRLRFPGLKSKDERDMDPYPTQTRSIDTYEENGVKPYMSHPALNMVVQPLNHRYHRSVESPSAPRSHSPSRSGSRKPMEIVELPQPPHDYPQSLSRNAIPAGMRTGAAPSSRSMDPIPYNLGSRSQPLVGASRPSNSTSVIETTIKPHPTPEIPEPTPRTQSVSQPATSSGSQTRTGPNDATYSSSSTGRVLTPSLSRNRLKDLPNTPSSHLRTTSYQGSAPSTVPLLSPLPPIPPIPPMPVTTDASPKLAHQSQSQLPTLSPSAPIYPSSRPQTQPTTNPAHQRRSTERPRPATSSHPRLRDGAPKLSLTTVNRLSLTMPDGYSARFSPSIVMRTPPLPILSLPPLPPIPSDPASSGTRQGKVGLRNMPELPHQGAELRDDGDGDDDDDEDEDGNDEDSEQEQENDDTATLRDGDSSIYHDVESSDERHRRPVESDTGVSLMPSLSSLRRTPSNRISGLPQVDVSRIDIDLSFLNYPPASSTGDLKGKGRVSPAPDSERTPTSTSVDYFSERPPNNLNDNNLTPTRTPRTLLTRTSTYASGTVSRPQREDSLPRRLSRNLEANVGLRPGMYKQASYSLIDIHAAEKKEMVEEMVRDAEQDAVVEEKVRRRRTVIASGKEKGKARESVGTGHHNLDVGILGPPPHSPAEPVHATEGEESNSNQTIKVPAYDAGPHRLRRRRSMPSFIATSDPPPYPTFERRSNMYGLSSQLNIQPRDDEGRERLPPYTNDIVLKAIVPRKMEFVAAGVQAKDRKWRRVVCVLEGTALKVYRCPASVAGVSTLSNWWEGKVGVGDVSYIGNTGASGSVAAREREREEEVRMLKGGNGLGQTDLQVPLASPQPAFSSPPLQRPVQPPPPSSSRSRLGLVNLLMPRRAHARSTSDTLTLPRPRSPRASLNIPVGTGGSELSSRSRTPTTPSSASTMSLSSPNSNSQTPSGQSSASSLRSPFPNAQNGNDSGGMKVATPELDPKPTDLIKAYTMQHAESGLGNDYLKRKNVIRVRVEGEQFLFQAKDVADVVAWIEGLQAAANVALDLDERPMPKGPLFPRRRRRRGARRIEAVHESGPLTGPVIVPPPL